MTNRLCAFCSIAMAAGIGMIAPPAKADETSCAGLLGKRFGDAVISAATSVTPPFSVRGLDPPTPVAVTKAFCRVQGTLRPSAESNILRSGCRRHGRGTANTRVWETAASPARSSTSR